MTRVTLGASKLEVSPIAFGTWQLSPRFWGEQSKDAVIAAMRLAFECGVNDLPLTMAISWFEQKAVAVLLTLLHLGVKGIRLGPVAPAFITPNVFKILQDKFDLKIIEAQPPKELFELTSV